MNVWQRLADRAQATPSVVQPRPAARFAPSPTLEGLQPTERAEGMPDLLEQTEERPAVAPPSVQPALLSRPPAASRWSEVYHLDLAQPQADPVGVEGEASSTPAPTSPTTPPPPVAPTGAGAPWSSAGEKRVLQDEDVGRGRTHRFAPTRESGGEHTGSPLHAKTGGGEHAASPLYVKTGGGEHAGSPLLHWGPRPLTGDGPTVPGLPEAVRPSAGHATLRLGVDQENRQRRPALSPQRDAAGLPVEAGLQPAPRMDWPQPASTPPGGEHTGSPLDVKTGSQPTPPTVQVHIGRIEVRAAPQPTPPVTPPRPPYRPALSLDEYLKQRQRGGG